MHVQGNGVHVVGGRGLIPDRCRRAGTCPALVASPEQAEQAAAAVPARVRLGALTPDMARLGAETRQVTHAIRMAA